MNTRELLELRSKAKRVKIVTELVTAVSGLTLLLACQNLENNIAGGIVSPMAKSIAIISSAFATTGFLGATTGFIAEKATDILLQKRKKRKNLVPAL